MNFLAEPVPVHAGFIVVIAASVITDLTPDPWSMIPATITLALLPAWWFAHRRREAHIRAVRERMACEPLNVRDGWEWPW